MSGYYFEGSLVRLRAVEAPDWEAYHAWDLDSETARSSYAIPFPRSVEGTRRWTEAESSRRPTDDMFRWTIEDKAGAVVGTLNTHSVARREGTFGYGLAIGREHRGKGYASQAIVLVLRYYFGELRYQKCTVDVYSFNTASIRLHESLGFQLEGRIRRTVYTDGRFFDDLIYGITDDEFAVRHPSPRMLP